MRPLLLALGLLVACSSSSPAPSAAADPEQLRKADLADGAEDHVVHKCASCGLAMDGKAEHAVKHGEYELHFCSDSCKTRMETDPEGVFRSMAAGL